MDSRWYFCAAICDDGVEIWWLILEQKAEGRRQKIIMFITDKWSLSSVTESPDLYGDSDNWAFGF
jgi:hypothetical protein